MEVRVIYPSEELWDMLAGPLRTAPQELLRWNVLGVGEKTEVWFGVSGFTYYQPGRQRKPDSRGMRSRMM